MKTNLTGRILLPLLIGCWLSVSAIGQITFVKTPETTANTRQPQPAQQGGLSQEKKKSLSKYGPEDAFPGASEQEGGQRQSNRTNTRRPSAIPSPTSTPTPSPTATPTPERIAATPSPITSPAVPATNTINTSSNSTTPPSSQSSGSTAVPIFLGTAALLVFGALVYVVGSLRKKLNGTR